MIHVSDQVIFFDPVYQSNERWEEVKANPNWQFSDSTFSPFYPMIAGLAKFVKRSSKTNYIGAYVCCFAENLSQVNDLFDHCPKFKC